MEHYGERLDHFKQLRDLRLTFWVPVNPRRGMFPIFFAEKLALSNMRSLQCYGTALPEIALQVSVQEDPNRMLLTLKPVSNNSATYVAPGSPWY